MKKTIFTLTIMAFALLLYSQESDNTDASSMQLARKHGHLCDPGNMEKISLQLSLYILSPENFNTYYKARREYVSAVTLWSIGGVVTAGFLGYSCVTFIMDVVHPMPSDSHYVDVSPLIAQISAGIALGSAILFFTPALVLTLDSHKKIDRIVASHNMKTNQTSLSFGPTRYGVGLSLNF